MERDRQRDRNVVYYNMVRKKVNGFGADLLEWPASSPDMSPIEQ